MTRHILAVFALGIAVASPLIAEQHVAPSETTPEAQPAD